MGHIRTKIYSNGSTAITAATDSDPPFDFSAAKSGSVVVRASNFVGTTPTLKVDVYFGARTRGFISVKSNIIWEATPSHTVTINPDATPANPVSGFVPVPVMKSPLMKVVFTPQGTGAGAVVQAYFEQVT
jgi:hypothetical protein